MRYPKLTYRSTGSSNRKATDHSKLWLECAKRELISDPMIKTSLQQLSVNPADSECIQFILEKIRAYDTQEILHPDSFRRTNPSVPGVVDGPIHMGTIQHSNLPWGIPPAMLTKHMVTFGMTGMGKSVTLRTLVRSLCFSSSADTQKPIIILPDRKNEFAGFAQSLNLPYFLPEHFPDHHCAPPDENCEHLWFNLYSEITAANIGLLAVGQSIIKGELTRLSQLYKKQGRGYPSTRELAIHIMKRANDSKGTVRDNLLRVGMHLMAFADYSNYSSASYSPVHWDKLLQTGWGISLAGMPVNFQFFDITLTFAKLLLHRIVNHLRSTDLEVLFVMDECRPIFGVSESKKTAILMDHFVQARAFGLGLVGASQTTNLAHEFLANTSIKVALGLGHGSDYSHFASAVGLNLAQQQQMHRFSKPGFAVVKDPRYPLPFTAQLAMGSNDALFMSAAETHRLSEENSRRLFGKLTVEPSQTVIRMSSSTIACQHPKSRENLRKILDAQARHPIQFLFRREAALKASVKGGASLLKAEKYGLEHEMIRKHFLACAKTQACLLELLDAGYELIDLPKPTWPSKGKYVHKFSVHRISHTYRQHGLRTKIEYLRPNGKLVDLWVSNGKKFFFIEVCASWPIEKELTNLERNLQGEPLPTEIIWAVTERKMKTPLQEALKAMDLHSPLIRPVRVVLAGDLIETLEVSK